MGEAEPTWYCEKCGSHHVISFTHGTQDCAACKRKDKEIERLRGALQEIAKQDPPGGEAYIAKAALEGKDET